MRSKIVERTNTCIADLWGRSDLAQLRYLPPRQGSCPPGRMVCINRSIVHATEGKGANAGLPQLRQPFRYKAAVSFIRAGRIKQVACLDKKINALTHSKISCALKGLAQLLPALFTFARMLCECSIAQVVISSQNRCDNTMATLLLGIGG